MNDKLTIRVLDENTANKIAAGEVVERPSSVIKELIENSIDALSTKIEIEICDGGKNLIRVTDDGIGMSPADAKMAILRHATSKIRFVDDLTRIESLGFRGEALPSIASVSRFSLLTRRHDSEFATLIEIEGGKIIETREAGGNVGTTIKVMDLFFNTPARKKFLKTNSTESNYISGIIAKLALSHPEIAFKLINNNKLVFATPGTNKLIDVISSIYGHKIGNEILPINFSEDNIMVTGYISKPTVLKSSRNWQTFLVNSRVIQSRFIAKAIDNAYHSLLPKVGYPLAVLNILLPLDSVDVNVHPQKSEVKFSNEQLVYRVVFKSISNTLKEAASNRENLVVNIDVPDQKTPKIQIRNDNNILVKSKETMALWRDEPLTFSVSAKSCKQEPLLATSNQLNFLVSGDFTNEQSSLQPLGQIDDCYIVARGEEGLYIIDQHAAHERILYDKMCSFTERIPAQQLLTPMFMEFDSNELDIIEANAEIFYKLGFNINQVGPNTIRLLEVPADIPVSEAEAIVKEIITKLLSMHNPTPGELRHAFLQTAACRAAVKAGNTLNTRQMRALLEDLFNTKLPYTCPHGRPAMIKFSSKDLAKMFKRR